MSAIEADEQQIHTDVDSIKDVLDPSDEQKLEMLQNDFSNSYNQSDELLKKARERYVVSDYLPKGLPFIFVKLSFLKSCTCKTLLLNFIAQPQGCLCYRTALRFSSLVYGLHAKLSFSGT